MNISSQELKLLQDFLKKESGIQIPDEKQYLFSTRLTSLLDELKCPSVSDFYKLLIDIKNNTLRQRFVQAMTIHESSFFRDSHPFDLFRDVLLPAVAQKRVAESNLIKPKLSILSAGCSAGQEPYTIAMILTEWLYARAGWTKDDLTITGIDISDAILDKARSGIYCELETGSKVEKRYRDLYFDKFDEKWIVKDCIKKMVRFKQVNLSETITGLGHFDIIFCRNVLIYFSEMLKQAILNQFRQMLNSGGVLILGASESLYGVTSQFKSVTKYNSTYFEPV